MAEQTLSLPAAHYSFGPPGFVGSGVKGWFNEGDPSLGLNLPVDDSLSSVTGNALQSCRVHNNGRIVLNFANDLSSLFETAGSLELTAGGNTLFIAMNSQDITDPYDFTPTNSQDVIAFYSALPTVDDGTAGTLVIRDFVPAAPSFADDTGDAISGTVGQAIADVTVPAATGMPAPTYAAVGNLPAGVSFDASTRTLSFDETAIVAGSGTITIRASNSQGSDDWSAPYSFAPPPVVSGNASAASWAFQVPAATGALVFPGSASSESWAFQVPDATGATVGPLDLSAWPEPAGERALIRALFVCGSPDIFNDGPFGTASGSFLAGDRELEAGQTISRIRNQGGDLRINDHPSTADVFGFFDTGGAGEGGTWYLTTDDGTFSTPEDLRAGGHGNNAQFGLSGAFATAFAGLSSGDRFILGYTVPRPSFAGDGSSASWAFQVPNATGGAGAPALSGNASPAAWAFQVPDATGAPVYFGDASSESWAFQVPAPTGQTTPPAFAGDAEAANWEIQVADASAQHIPPGNNGIAENVNWEFDVPDTATGQTTPPAFTGAASGATFEFDVPNATGATDAPLALSDFISTGLQTEALALIQAAAGPDVYAVAPRGSRGMLLGGEAGLSATDEPITRLRFRNAALSGAGGAVITLNDDGTLPLNTYFGGEGSDLTCWVQARTATISFPVAGNIRSSGGNFINLNVPSAAQATVAGIQANDRFIFALTRGPAYPGSAAAVNWLFNVPEATGGTNAPRNDGDAAAVGWVFSVPDATGATVPPNFAGDAAAATFEFDVPTATGETSPPGSGAVPEVVSWTFDVPVATGQTTPPNFTGSADAAGFAFEVATAVGNTVPPGSGATALAANWLFEVPAATGQATIPDRAGDASPANWLFQVPAPTGRAIAPQGGDAEGAEWAFQVPSSAEGASGIIGNNADAVPANWAFRVHDAIGEAVNPVQAVRPSPPLFPRLEGGAGMCLDLLWEPPMNDGGGEITRYEAFFCDETGFNCGWEIVGADGTRRHRFRGLRAGGTYRVRMRAWNDAGPSDESEEVEAFPYTMPATIVPPPGAALPLIDADRQSLIVRLDNKDCRITVWWQPSDESWYAQLEVPTNTVVVTGRRLALNAGILDRLEGDAVLAGNIVCREIGESGLDPARDAWRSGNYALKWEPDAAD